MEDILHQLIGSLSHYLQGFTSKVVQDSFHQQYHHFPAPAMFKVTLPTNQKFRTCFPPRQTYTPPAWASSPCHYLHFQSGHVKLACLNGRLGSIPTFHYDLFHHPSFKPTIFLNSWFSTETSRLIKHKSWKIYPFWSCFLFDPHGPYFNSYFREAFFFLGGGNSNIFYFHPENWGRFPIWRAYFFRWVETTSYCSFLKTPHPQAFWLEKPPWVLFEQQFQVGNFFSHWHQQTNPWVCGPLQLCFFFFTLRKIWVVLEDDTLLLGAKVIII